VVGCRRSRARCGLHHPMALHKVAASGVHPRHLKWRRLQLQAAAVAAVIVVAVGIGVAPLQAVVVLVVILFRPVHQDHRGCIGVRATVAPPAM